VKAVVVLLESSAPTLAVGATPSSRNCTALVSTMIDANAITLACLDAPDDNRFRAATGTALVGGVPPLAAAHASAEQRRAALEMLAAARLRGCIGATLLAHGFNVDMLADFVRDGLATAYRETVTVDGRETKLACLRITDAGRRALEGDALRRS